MPALDLDDISRRESGACKQHLDLLSPVVVDMRIVEIDN